MLNYSNLRVLFNRTRSGFYVRHRGSSLPVPRLPTFIPRPEFVNNADLINEVRRSCGDNERIPLGTIQLAGKLFQRKTPKELSESSTPCKG